MSNMLAWKYEGREVRTVQREGQPWWVAKDVCDVLELSNPSEALRGLDDDERDTLSNPEGISTDGRAQSINIVNEPGLYSLILRSRKPEAKRFKRWITHEVIPSIRKTSGYSMPNSRGSVVQQAEFLLELARKEEEQDRQIADAKRIAQAALDVSESNYGMYSVLAFARLHNLPMPNAQASNHGKNLSNVCKERGLKTGRVRDARWGSVNTYPETLLREYFGWDCAAKEVC